MKIPEHSAFILIDVEVTGSPINAADEGNNDKVNKYHDSVLKALYFFRLQKDVPIIHVIEKHRDDLSDIGRELDGAEYVHDLESNTDFWAPSAPAGGADVASSVSPMCSRKDAARRGTRARV